jgi:hypothetical protein
MTTISRQLSAVLSPLLALRSHEQIGMAVRIGVFAVSTVSTATPREEREGMDCVQHQCDADSVSSEGAVSVASIGVQTEDGAASAAVTAAASEAAERVRAQMEAEADRARRDLEDARRMRDRVLEAMGAARAEARGEAEALLGERHARQMEGARRDLADLRRDLEAAQAQAQAAQKEAEAFRDKYETLESSTVMKGEAFESLVEERLTELCARLDNAWTLQNRAREAHKGDFVATNRYTGVRIMLELKHMPQVSATLRDQQPKFVANLLDEANCYDGGVLVASGTIDRKHSFLVEREERKVTGYIERYSVKHPEHIVLMLNIVHDQIMRDRDTGSGLRADDVLPVLAERYAALTDAQRRLGALVAQNDREVTQLKLEAKRLCGVDLEEYIRQRKDARAGVAANAEDRIADFARAQLRASHDAAAARRACYDHFAADIRAYAADKKKGFSKQKINACVKKVAAAMEKSAPKGERSDTKPAGPIVIAFSGGK